MIKEFLIDGDLAERALLIQHLAYRIEADLIGFEGIPPLHESLADLRQRPEIFRGYFLDEQLVAFVAYEIIDGVLDICRLVVHPAYARRGIGQMLIRSLEGLASKTIVSTGAANLPARKLYEFLGFSLLEEITLPVGLVIANYAKLS